MLEREERKGRIKRKGTGTGDVNVTETLAESSNFSDFVLRWMTAKQKTNPAFTQRLMARKLGYENPSYFNEVLRGRRKANFQFFLKFKDYLKLSGLEAQYFSNLYAIDCLNDDDNQSDAMEENRMIRMYWSSSTDCENGYLPIDTLIITFLAHPENLRSVLRITQIAESLTPFLDHELLMQRLSFLEKEGLIDFTSQGVLVNRETLDNKKYKTKAESYQSLIPSLIQVMRSGKAQPEIQFLSTVLTRSEFQKAQGIIAEAYERVVLLAIESEQKKHTPKDLNVYSFFDCSNPVSI